MTGPLTREDRSNTQLTRCLQKSVRDYHLLAVVV